MKLCFPVLLHICLFQVVIAHAQIRRDTTRPNPFINYAKVNMHQWAGYKPEKADPGKNAQELTFFQRMFHGRNNGLDGKKGFRGPDLLVKIDALRSGDSIILHFIVGVPGDAQSTIEYFVNPRYGKIKIVSDGGDGGDGGKGSKGKIKASYRNMCGGNGGDGGDGGDAGYITVHVDSTAIPYVNNRCMTFSNFGGIGGQGGDGGKGRSLTGYKKKPLPHDGEDGLDGVEGNSSNRIVMIGPNGNMIGWK
ncbi:hypothetical protein SAMN05421788_106182 [Filimonas lacunae]|uniref:Uncharacterized protein n=1 Tax=Filimonas lacunae TaxID=477680 RepID=A0A173MFB7_9BACT|nr:hypothetical protein [Filimonas lacunae]BAV06121.1 GTP-binding protein Obg [Filimonas lacunae]SIT24750.1 hypothetical protein SAMN05421788_106182 [Filimonas lacunae]